MGMTIAINQIQERDERGGTDAFQITRNGAIIGSVTRAAFPPRSPWRAFGDGRPGRCFLGHFFGVGGFDAAIRAITGPPVED